MFEMLCCSRCFTHFLNAKARQVFEHYEARQLGWTFVFFGKAASEVSCAIWRKYILSAKASRPRTEQACTA